MRSEYNCAWVRNKIKERGLTEEIEKLAYLMFIARYMPTVDIDRQFFEIVGESSDR